MKRAVLIIHGFAGSPTEHIEIINYLNQSFDTYSYYLPGHDKGILNHPRKEEWIKKSEEKIEMLSLKYDEVYVIGHSLGGVIGTHLACKYSIIKKLVLEAPAFEYDMTPGLKLFEEYDKKFFLTAATKLSVLVLKEFMDLVKKYKNKIKKVNIPTLIIQGTADILVPYQSSVTAFNEIKCKDKYLVLVDNLIHNLFLDKRYRDIIKMVEDFLKNDNFDSEKYSNKLNKDLIRK